MNPSGPTERITVARYDDDYPLAYPVAGYPERPAVEDGHAPPVDEATGRTGSGTKLVKDTVQIDLLDGWMRP